MLNISATNCA